MAADAGLTAIAYSISRRTTPRSKFPSGIELAAARFGGLADHAAAERADELGLRHRLGEQIALADVAADALQLVALVRGLDAFGDGLEAEALGQFDDGLAQAGIHLVQVAIGDIAAVDLELAERQLPQPRQRRIAGAEIVERERAIQRAQLVGDFVGDLEIVA